MAQYDAAEIAGFREYEQERNGLTAPTVQYGSLSLGDGFEPVYGEAAPNKFVVRPVKVVMRTVPAQDLTVSVDQAGQTSQQAGKASIAWTDWKAVFPDREPSPGDRIDENDFGWFDVIGAAPGGVLNDRMAPVGYLLEILWKSRQSPDRR